jgi:hypothetical protein
MNDHSPAPATAAVVLTCAACWDEWWPGAVPPGNGPGSAQVVAVHIADAAEFVAHGFEVVPIPGIRRGTTVARLSCPHLAEADLDAFGS